MAASGAGGSTDPLLFMHALDRMMLALSAESAHDAKAIKDAYRPHLDLLVLDEYSELEDALYTGGLARLPDDPLRFNLSPRLSGSFPIAEKDLENQPNYIAARPAAIGALLTVASRVQSGPVEVTSLVRHSEYQGALQKTNTNATTAVPMHTMGLAFDIALVNTPLSRAYEIRDVLRQMRDAGDILFIGERQQLVFHVVPHPSRLGYFTDVYTRALTAGAAETDFSPPGIPVTSGLPTVTAEVVDVLPSKEIEKEWWAADAPKTDLEVDVRPAGALVPAPSQPAAPRKQRPLTPMILMIGGTLTVFGYRKTKTGEASAKSLLIT